MPGLTMDPDDFHFDPDGDDPTGDAPSDGSDSGEVRTSYGDPQRTDPPDAATEHGYCERIDLGDGRSVWKGPVHSFAIDGELIAMGHCKDIDVAAQKLRDGATARKALDAAPRYQKLESIKRLSLTRELGAFTAIVGPIEPVGGRLGAGAEALFESLRQQLAPGVEPTREPASVNDIGFDPRMKYILIAAGAALFFFIGLMDHLGGKPAGDGGGGIRRGPRGIGLIFKLTEAAGPTGTILLMLAAIGWGIYEFFKFRKLLPDREVVQIPK